MSSKIEVKGSTAAQVVGVLVTLYGVMIFIISITATESLNLAAITLLTLSALAIIVGIGLVNHNYHSWFVAIVLNAVSLIGGGAKLILLYSKSQAADASNVAVNLFWPLIIFWLLYSARDACRSRKGNSSIGLWVLKLHAPVLSATLITLATILYAKAIGAGAFFLLGFPVLIIEFGILYVAGQSLQKRLGWDNPPAENSSEGMIEAGSTSGDSGLR